MARTGLPRKTPDSTLADFQSLRRLPVGAEPILSQGVHFRVWAPRADRVELCLLEESNECQQTVPLTPEPHGYYSVWVPDIQAGQRYAYRLNEEGSCLPDPASRFQPQGPHGPSQVIDPTNFRWTDQAWRGIRREGLVLYELHIGTFTPQGNWQEATEQLAELADLGIGGIELMPVADFPGEFGWGYDGVDLFAPTRLYGDPDGFRRFVDQAHGLGLGVILDVVYNHLGPDGNYLKHFSEDYFSRTYTTDWGEAINFDGPNCQPVREFYLANVQYWIDEFHLDGLRIDATQDIYDRSSEHILAAMGQRARQAAEGRTVLMIAENEPQRIQLVLPQEAGGYGLDQLWNDDFHHSAMVRISGRKEAYYSDYLGRPQEFISAIKYGYLYQGQWYTWQQKPRGTPSRDLPPTAFINYIQNHDQIANTAQGKRAHQWTSPGIYKATSALLLLAPQIPMLFQGQEFAASSPFYYFADHKPELAELVDRGRREFMKQFPSIANPEVQSQLPHPANRQTFERSKLNFAEREVHGDIYTMHRDLLRLRREDPVFGGHSFCGVDGAVLAEEAFVLRFFGPDDNDRLLLVNFDVDLLLRPLPEPLLAPPVGFYWQVIWSTEDLLYGGAGTPPLNEKGGWLIPGQTAMVLVPFAAPPEDVLSAQEQSS